MSKLYRGKRQRRLLITASLLPVALSGAPVLAQDAQPDPAAPEPTNGVQDIIVTAQRRTQNLQTVPAAVTALSPEVLTERNVASTQDLMRVTPGLQVSTLTGGTGSASASFFLRGMGQQRAANGAEPAVGIYVDDIYYPTLQGANFDIVDLAGVEVLRGPQGTLFGRNTIGGAIRYITARPGEDFAASVSGTLGSYNRRDLTGFANVPLGDKAAIRFTAGHLERDGFVRRQSGGPNAGASTLNLGRVALRADPASNFSVDITAQYQESELDGFGYVTLGPIVFPPSSLLAPYNLTPAGRLNPLDNRYAAQCGFCQAGSNAGESSRNNTFNGSVILSWDISSDLTLKSLTGYTKLIAKAVIDYDGTPLNLYQANQNNETEALSQELQLNAKLFDDRLNVVGGLFYYEDEYRYNFDLAFEGFGTFFNPARFSANGTSPATPQRRNTKSYAAYADATFALTDQLTFILGGRYSEDHKTAQANINNTGVFSTNTATFDSATGRIGLKYQAASNAMVYATVSTGFRAGGFNYAAAIRRFVPFQPENSRSYEVGGRFDLFDRHLRLNPTFFYNDWKNIQVQSVVPDAATGINIVSLDNAAKAHTYGFELETTLALNRNFEVYGTLALLRARYDSIGTATGITVDTEFQRAPEVTYSLGATFRQDVSGFGAVANVNWSWQGSQYSTPTLTDRLFLPSYGVLGARLQVTDPSKRFTLAVFGTNLTNEVYYVGGVGYSYNVGINRYDVGRAREFGVNLKIGF